MTILGIVFVVGDPGMVEGGNRPTYYSLDQIERNLKNS